MRDHGQPGSEATGAWLRRHAIARTWEGPRASAGTPRLCPSLRRTFTTSMLRVYTTRSNDTRFVPNR